MQTTELSEDVCQEEHVRLQVELQLLLERVPVEGFSYIDCSGIVRLSPLLIVEVREDCVWRWQCRIIHLVLSVEVLVGEDAIAE